MLAALEEILRLYPEDVNLRIAQLNCLRDLSRRDQRLAVFGELCGRPEADPILRRQYAQELLADARERTKVELAASGERSGRVPRMRSASGYSPRPRGNGVVSTRPSNFIGSRPAWTTPTRAWPDPTWTRRGTCAWTRKRSSSWKGGAGGSRRNRPSRRERCTGRCYSSSGGRKRSRCSTRRSRSVPATATCSGSPPRRTRSHGEFDRALVRLEAAHGLCREADWLRTSAFLASAQGDLVRSLALWRQVLEAEPMALDANRAVAQRLAETEGRAAALEHLSRACDRFPHNYLLTQTWILWLRRRRAGRPRAGRSGGCWRSSRPTPGLTASWQSF